MLIAVEKNDNLDCIKLLMDAGADFGAADLGRINFLWDARADADEVWNQRARAPTLLWAGWRAP